MTLNGRQRALEVLRTLDVGPHPQNGRMNIISAELQQHFSGSSLNRYVSGPGGARVAHRDYMQAVEEAFDSLLRDGLIARQAGQQSDNWVVVTELGRKVREQESDVGLRAIEAQKLLAMPLHDRLEKAHRDFRDGDYEGAVMKAFRAVEIAVREAGGYTARDIGKDLMMKAWAPGSGPLSDTELPEPEQDGFKFLFAGAVAAFKNPTSHREVDYEDPAEVAEIVLFADLLLRVTDRAADRPS